jgi:alpha-tubulin N-acetyltransferase 1
MIECESVEARSLGYDRPSEKLLNFLDKYYSLKSYVPQNNNFVVFDDYFESNYINKGKSSLFDNNFNYKDNGKNEKDNENDKSHINRCQTSYYDHIDTLKKQEQLNDKYNKYSKFQGVTKSETKLKTREYNVNLNLKDNDLDDIEKKFSKVNINDEYEPKKKQKRNSAEHRIEDYYQNLIKPNNKKNPPWAVSDSYNAFMPTSSSYGAYFKVNKKYR